jgi:hypothetical protein
MYPSVLIGLLIARHCKEDPGSLGRAALIGVALALLAEERYLL